MCYKGRNIKINGKKTSLKLKDMNSDVGEIPIIMRSKGLISRHVVVRFFTRYTEHRGCSEGQRKGHLTDRGPDSEWRWRLQ